MPKMWCDEEMVQTGLRPIRLPGLVINGSVLPAPLAGYTDSAFRTVMKRYGAPLVYTEMLSAGGIIKDFAGSKQYLKRREEEGLVGYQLVGKEVRWMVESAKICESAGASLIDINAGCTDLNVKKQGGGAALLKDPHTLWNIVKSVSREVSVPVTCKLRIPQREWKVDLLGIA
ncbi:MAG TPA: tRNA-dihydrouridine synthase family protein, partial [Euryarchaeota archaeon]|nr:tRNA-dihydrouridine synthase family protein [Euryarchaeota archaeon]